MEHFSSICEKSTYTIFMKMLHKIVVLFLCQNQKRQRFVI